MKYHTLTEKQSRELGKVLEQHISNGIPVGDAGKPLLESLQRLKPNSDQEYATLYTSPEEEELFQALVNSHWGPPKREDPERE